MPKVVAKAFVLESYLPIQRFLLTKIRADIFKYYVYSCIRTVYKALQIYEVYSSLGK